MRCPLERQSGQVGQNKGRAADTTLPPSPAGAARGTSRSASSGALSRSRAAARAGRRPASSPRAVARTLTSTTITIGAQRRYRRLQRNRTSRAAAARSKTSSRVGSLASSMSRALKYSWRDCARRLRVDAGQHGSLGHIFDLHARHGAMIALEAPFRKRGGGRGSPGGPGWLRRGRRLTARRILKLSNTSSGGQWVGSRHG